MNARNLKYKTYAMTLRPRNGITDEMIPTVSEWIKKRSTYYHIITEKEGYSRHIHAAVYLKQDVLKGNFCNIWTRLMKQLGLDDEELVCQRKGVKILYNHDFVESYMDKDDNTEVIASNLPEKNFLESWYPVKQTPSEARAKKCSAYYWELERLWYEHQRPGVEVNTENCRHFLFNMMYNERCINVIRDDKTIIQTARHLTRWINKTTESTIELAPFEQEE